MGSVRLRSCMMRCRRRKLWQIHSFQLSFWKVLCLWMEGEHESFCGKVRGEMFFGRCSGSYWLESPCDCDSLICNDTDHCQGGAPWMDDAVYDENRRWIPQEIMCGFGQKGNSSISVTISNTDSFHPTYQVHPVHFANIWNSWYVSRFVK